MPRHALPDGEQHSTQVRIYVTREEYDRILQAAHRLGISGSALGRQAVLQVAAVVTSGTCEGVVWLEEQTTVDSLAPCNSARTVL